MHPILNSVCIAHISFYWLQKSIYAVQEAFVLFSVLNDTGVDGMYEDICNSPNTLVSTLSAKLVCTLHSYETGWEHDRRHHCFRVMY